MSLGSQHSEGSLEGQSDPAVWPVAWSDQSGSTSAFRGHNSLDGQGYSCRWLCASEVKRLIWEGVITLDARSAAEHLHGPLEGSLHVGMHPSSGRLRRLGITSNDPVICVCDNGRRASQLSAHLQGLGYRSVYCLGEALGSCVSDQRD